MYRQRLLSSVCFSKYFTGVLKFKNKILKNGKPLKKKALSKFAIFNPSLTGDRFIEIYFVKYEKN